MPQINSEVRAIFINGTKVPVVDGTFTSTFGGFERTSVMGSGQRLGSTRQAVPGSCSFEVTYTKDTDVDGTYDVEDAEVRVVWDRGNEWLCRRADLQTPPEVSAPEGRVSLTYEGDKWIITR